ncbi:hypothetical protein B0H14DRAFT_3519176 [Mycena olivaceomarginata]|nr:hypothetical protein B0H14DRAFT_3519176 [Mycena olivaceomarginata]
MPVLLPSAETHLANPANILFFFNVQHDCYGLKCLVAAIQHVDTDTYIINNTYIINMHALHIAHLLRDTLPQSLTAPIPYMTDRDAKHDELAASLRVSGPEKQTREKNKQAKIAARAQGSPEADGNDDDNDDDERQDMNDAEDMEE